MRKNKILSVIGGLAAFIFTSCDGIFDVDYYTFLSEDYIFTNESTIEEGLLGCYELLYPFLKYGFLDTLHSRKQTVYTTDSSIRALP